MLCLSVVLMGLPSLEGVTVTMLAWHLLMGVAEAAITFRPRAVVLCDGVIVADGSTYDVLTDRDLMVAHRLELPDGFDPRALVDRSDG